MEGKICSRCKQFKPLTQFGFNSYHVDGLRSECKSCQASWYQQNKDKRNKSRKDWALANPEKQRLIELRKYRKHRLTRNCQKKSRRKFSEVQLCSVVDCLEKGERHHFDYNKPNEIIWLCSKHHRLLHRLLNNINHT